MKGVVDRCDERVMELCYNKGMEHGYDYGHGALR